MQQPHHGRGNRPACGNPPGPAENTDLPEPWQVWLNGHPRTADRRRGQLAFFLELIPDEEAPAARVEVAPVWWKPKSRGNPAGSSPLDSSQLAGAPLDAGEQRLLARVLGLPTTARKDRHYARLSGAPGDALLQEMLDTAPCFLGGVAGLHLTRGKAQTPAWQWLRRSDGSQKLLPRTARNRRLLIVGSLWYLDTEQATLGLLQSAHDGAVLLGMPPIAPAQSAAFAAALAASPRADQMPAPRVFDSPRVVDSSPASILTLHALPDHAGSSEDAASLSYARLGFAYAGIAIDANEHESMQVSRVHKGRWVQIHRRRAEELAAIEQLEACGLRPAVDTEGLPWEVARHLPDDAWLFPGAGHRGALEVNTPARWLALRERLHQAGFGVEYDAGFPVEVLDVPVQWYARARESRGHRRFELEVGVQWDDQRTNLLPAITRALADGQWTWVADDDEPPGALWYAPLDARRRLPVRLDVLRRLLAPLAEHLQKPTEHVRLPRVQAGRLEELAEALPDERNLSAPAALRDFTARLRKAASRAQVSVPATVQATLRPYQRDGLRWLNALAEAGIGGVLADDMGLGKTLQVLAHLLALREAGQLTRPVLVVAPTSLIPNWESETARFAPTLSVLTLSGPQRGECFEAIDQHDLILTSYALLPRDIVGLKKHVYALVVLDEAQQVKNPRTRARRAALALKAPRHLCMTGTPLENHLGELWSQLDLAVPGLLGDQTAFRQHYRVPIEKHHDEDCQRRLNQRLAPFILRRTKAQVATELPPKTEVARRIIMPPGQRQLYDQLRERLSEELHAIIAERGIEHAGIVVLDALLKLRQVCCDPRLLKNGDANGVRESAKFALLMEMLPALLAEGRRLLVFSQFTEMLKLIADELDDQRIPHVTLTGDTRDRAEPVRRFQDGEVPLFLLSLRAGGVGLNLTAADAVIHYDPWWNPAAEAQASDRAHRIGQDKPVFVYRLITADTVEERIEAMKARKAELAEAVLAGGGSRERLRFDEEDLEALLAPGE